MAILRSILGIFFDFFLPKKQSVLEIEAMDAGELKEGRVMPPEPALLKDEIHPLLRYRDSVVRQAVWELKYRGNKRIAKLFSEILHEEILSRMEDEIIFENLREILVVPVPVSPKRLRERGWNQMELVATELGKLLPSDSFRIETHILEKRKETPRQSTLKDRRLRLHNLQGTFSVSNPEKIEGKTIIVIDDVLTTGSTLREARRALLKARAKKVISFALAH